MQDVASHNIHLPSRPEPSTRERQDTKSTNDTTRADRLVTNSLHSLDDTCENYPSTRSTRHLLKHACDVCRFLFKKIQQGSTKSTQKPLQGATTSAKKSQRGVSAEEVQHGPTISSKTGINPLAATVVMASILGIVSCFYISIYYASPFSKCVNAKRKGRKQHICRKLLIVQSVIP